MSEAMAEPRCQSRLVSTLSQHAHLVTQYTPATPACKLVRPFAVWHSGCVLMLLLSHGMSSPRLHKEGAMQATDYWSKAELIDWD